MSTQRWTVGETVITRVVEDEIQHVPPELFFPDATAADAVPHDWLRPDFVDDVGNLSFAVQAFVVQHGGATVMVDPCVGNGKSLAFPFWADQSYPFMERFEAAGFATASIDLVVHTHLHEDHIGWGTTKVGDEWQPTFTNARYLYSEVEIEHRHRSDEQRGDRAYEQSIAPIFAAGLADTIADDAELADGLWMEPSPGHTPGHVSVHVESAGSSALVSGDFLHHPLQVARTDLREVADHDIEQARATRRRMLASVADRDILFLGTHFPTVPAGRVVSDGDAYRFVPVAPTG